jgi:hypothetical protein
MVLHGGDFRDTERNERCISLVVARLIFRGSRFHFGRFSKFKFFRLSEILTLINKKNPRQSHPKFSRHR